MTIQKRIRSIFQPQKHVFAQKFRLAAGIFILSSGRFLMQKGMQKEHFLTRMKIFFSALRESMNKRKQAIERRPSH